jgi:hypothetical protein
MRFFRPYMKPMKSGHITRGEQSSEGTGVAAPDPLVLAALEADLLDKGRRIDATSRQFQELWFALLQRSWRSLALVPGDAGGSANEIAISLTEVGRVLHESVSSFVTTDTLDYASAAEVVAAAGSSTPAGTRPVEPVGRIIAALPPVVADPLGLKIVAAADLVVICIEMGRTRLAAVRRTIELVGRDRIAGCLLIQ